MPYSATILDPNALDVELYESVFVNQSAYAQMTNNRVDPAQNHYYRPRVDFNDPTSEFRSLTSNTVRRHLRGDITCMFYANNPETQRSKWICLDADYGDAIRDLDRIESSLKSLGISTLWEDSRRGGHLWVLNDAPLLSVGCRRFINHVVCELGIPFAATPNDPPGVEVFPRQDSLEDGRLGNGLRGPLGVHRKDFNRYWFRGANQSLSEQLKLVKDVERLTEERLNALLIGVPETDESIPHIQPIIFRSNRATGEFSILNHFPPPRSSARDYKVVCPACKERKLVITADGVRKGFYKCFGGCKTKEIRAALGHPVVYKGA